MKLCDALNPRLFGTPKELLQTFVSNIQLLSENAWDAHQRGTLVVDIDGTICGAPHNGDYSQVEPIEDMCEAFAGLIMKDTILFYSPREICELLMVVLV